MEEVSYTGTGDDVRASGVLLFDSMQEYDKECVPVDFLEDNMLREQRTPESGGHAQSMPWCREEDHVQDGSGTDDYGPDPGHQTARRSSRVASRVRRATTTRSRLTRQRPGTATRSNTRRAERGVVRDGRVENMRTQLESLTEHVQVLHRKIAAHESHFLSRSDVNSRHADLDAVKRMKMFLRNRLLSEFQKPLRKPYVGTGESDFSSFLRIGSVKCSIECDLTSFQKVVKDVLTMSTRTSRQVKFLPSLTSILHGPHGMPLGTIIFDEDTPVFQWLELRNPEDRLKLKYRTQCTQMVQAIRLVAGVQTNTGDSTSFMSIFPGRSCSAQPRVTSNVVEERGRCLHRQTTAWDEENQCFVDSLELSAREPCLSSITDLEHDNSSCISLTWAFKDGISSNMWSVDATHTGDVTLGTLQLSLPVVYFYGMRLCSEVEEKFEEI